MKSCSRCGEWKSSRHFYPDRRGRSADGLLHSCKDCERDAAAARARAKYVPKLTMKQARDSVGRFAKVYY